MAGCVSSQCIPETEEQELHPWWVEIIERQYQEELCLGRVNVGSLQGTAPVTFMGSWVTVMWITSKSLPSGLSSCLNVKLVFLDASGYFWMLMDILDITPPYTRLHSPYNLYITKLTMSFPIEIHHSPWNSCQFYIQNPHSFLLIEAHLSSLRTFSPLKVQRKHEESSQLQWLPLSSE